MVSSWLALYWAITLFRVSCTQAHQTNNQESLKLIRLLRLVAFSMHTHRKCHRENISRQHALIYLNDGRQHTLRVVCAQRSVNFCELCWKGSSQHSQPNVHLESIFDVTAACFVLRPLHCNEILCSPSASLESLMYFE